MVSPKRRTRDESVRNDILRGVYEQNLSMLRKTRSPFERQKAPRVRKSLLGAAAFVFIIAIQAGYTGISSPPLAQLTGSGMRGSARPALPASSDDALKGSELRSIENSGSAPMRRMLGLKVRTIMIDPGHGGNDAGTRGAMGTLEKDVALDIATRLKAYLTPNSGAHVLMTRESDRFVPLARRVDLARESHADLFVSVHLNYLSARPIDMIETYYFGPSDDRRTIKLAEHENAGSEYGLSDFRKIVEKLGATMKLQESRELARSIQGVLVANSRRHNGSIRDYGVKKAPFVVLVGVDVPAVLVEVSCLSNSEEEHELNSESHRDNIARYLAAGIFAYLDEEAVTHEARR